MTACRVTKNVIMCLVHKTAKCDMKINGTETVKERIAVQGVMFYCECKQRTILQIVTVKR
jgi:hypothetical protein